MKADVPQAAGVAAGSRRCQCAGGAAAAPEKKTEVAPPNGEKLKGMRKLLLSVWEKVGVIRRTFIIPSKSILITKQRRCVKIHCYGQGCLYGSYH